MALRNFQILANAPLLVGYRKVKSILGKGNLIALDGVSNVLKKWNLFPNIILGDFDSISDDTKKFFLENKVEIIHTPSQDATDLEKAINLCDERKAQSIEIYNALGGRTDHTFGNLSFLKKCYRKNRSIKLYNQKECLEYLEDVTLGLEGKKGDLLAILGFPEAYASSHGLSYDMKDYLLCLGKSESVSNSLALARASLNITGQSILIYSENIRVLKS